jgi:hypothetical protein
MPLITAASLPADQIPPLSPDGPTAVAQAWDYHRGYWNQGAFIQALNLGILAGAINTVR